METYDTSFKNHTDYVDPLKYMDFAIYAAMLDYDNRQYVLLDSYHKLFISNNEEDLMGNLIVWTVRFRKEEVVQFLEHTAPDLLPLLENGEWKQDWWREEWDNSLVERYFQKMQLPKYKETFPIEYNLFEEQFEVAIYWIMNQMEKYKKEIKRLEEVNGRLKSLSVELTNRILHLLPEGPDRDRQARTYSLALMRAKPELLP